MGAKAIRLGGGEVTWPSEFARIHPVGFRIIAVPPSKILNFAVTSAPSGFRPSGVVAIRSMDIVMAQETMQRYHAGSVMMACCVENDRF